MIPAMDHAAHVRQPSCSGIRVEPVAVNAVVGLRHQVLRAGLPREAAIFEGDSDPHSVHLAAFEGDVVVGCVTLHASHWEGRPAWQLRGMAVAPGYQKSGVGRALLASIDAHIATDGNKRMLWCNARVPAAMFYQKHGWEIVSDVFEIPTAGPHLRMVKHC
jgi:GNAT superfamily N-acetyltransferase